MQGPWRREQAYLQLAYRGSRAHLQMQSRRAPLVWWQGRHRRHTQGESDRWRQNPLTIAPLKIPE